MALTRPKLVAFLSDRGCYEAVDDTILDEIFFNLDLMRQAKKDIKERGIMCNVSANQNVQVLQKNHSCSVYDSALKNVMNISRRLGLTPRDRKELDLKVEEKDNF